MQGPITAHKTPAPPSLGQILLLWFAIGAQSFGGGAATLALIRRQIVDTRSWMTDEEFIREWTLCQVAPGINLLAMTILVGRRLHGVTGSCVALIGLLAPSVAITIVMTAGYARYRDLAIVKSAVSGIIPATVGVGLVTAVQMAVPILRAGHKDGRPILTISLLVLILSAAAVAFTKSPIVLILGTAGAIGALAQWRHDLSKPSDGPVVP